MDSFGVEVRPGDLFRGVRLSPAACNVVLGCNPATLRNQILPSSHLPPAIGSKLFELLNGSGSFEEAIAAYDLCLRSLKLMAADVDGEVATAIRLIEANCGQVRVGDVAAAVGLSVRQLERRFRATAGLSPKQFARIRRVRATAVKVVEDGEKNWAARATEMGYADQSHLTREFVSLIGRSPISFAEDIAQIEHGDLLK
jgi:AraC-like DNA-binding protein